MLVIVGENIKKMKTKMKSNYLEKRMDLVKKKGEDKNYKPTPEELEELMDI